MKEEQRDGRGPISVLLMAIALIPVIIGLIYLMWKLS